MDTAAAAAKFARGQLKFKSDRFCWVCHTDQPDYMWRCPTCPRSYHCGCCVRDMPGHPRPNVHRPGGTNEVPKFVMLECPECIVGKVTFEGNFPTMKNRSQEDVSSILNQICKVLRGIYVNNPYVDIMKVEEPVYESTVGKVVDIMGLEEMIKLGQLVTLEGFLGELKWILHNSLIFEGSESPICGQSKDLIEAGRKEVKSAAACPDCFLSLARTNGASDKDNEWFLKTCHPPHILAWVKYLSYPWWPSKIISINGDMANVKFFADGTNADIPLKNCRLYSKERPKEDSKSKSKQSKSKANCKKLQLEASMAIHITELEKTYGPVVLAPNGKTPMVTKLDAKGIRVMFPNYSE